MQILLFLCAAVHVKIFLCEAVHVKIFLCAAVHVKIFLCAAVHVKIFCSVHELPHAEIAHSGTIRLTTGIQLR